MLRSTTILSRSSDELLSLLGPLLSSPHKTRVFALSTNHSDHSLTRLTKELTEHPSTVGCLSAPLPGYSDHIACSVSLWDETATVFRSTIPGKQEISVGKWHSFRKAGASDDSGKEELTGPVNWDDVWAMNTKTERLPSALASLNPQTVHQVMFLSDNAPEGLSNTLARHLPGTSKLGLLTTSTVFKTGRPFTLFHNGSIHSSGAVGIAIGPSPLSKTIDVQYRGLHAITPPMTVTRTEGNMVISLDDQNPTAILLDAIDKHGLTQSMGATGRIEDDHQFYLGVVGNGEHHLAETYHIMSGDPARGPIALWSDKAPAPGSPIQVFHRTPTRDSELHFGTRKQIGFVTSMAETSRDGIDDVVVLDDAFIAASENGFVIGQEHETGWRCTVPEAIGGWGY